MTMHHDSGAAHADGEKAAAAAIARYRAKGVSAEAVTFARTVVAATRPTGVARARALLWACSRLAEWGSSVGLDARPEVLLHPSVIERYVGAGSPATPASRARTVRTNLRFVARRTTPSLPHPPEPMALARDRAKTPYREREIDAFFALARAQPTAARTQRLTALLCLGLGAGLAREDLRLVRGCDVVSRAGGLVVVVKGPRARTVPVVAAYHEPLMAAAAFAGDRLILGGVSETRRNLTATLTGRLAGGSDLVRLDASRLRATWLAGHLQRLGVGALLAAAGISCSQRLGDLTRAQPAVSLEELVGLLDGRC